MYSQLKKLQGKAITESAQSTQYGTTQGAQRNTQYNKDPPPTRSAFIVFKSLKILYPCILNHYGFAI